VFVALLVHLNTKAT